MQDDEDAKETRILNRLKGAAITRNEARISLGEDAVDGGDVFLDSAGVIPTPADADPWSGDTGRKPSAPLDWSENPAGEGEDMQPGKNLQADGADVDLALNGAQVMAARQIVSDVVFGALPPETAVQMLITLFNVPDDVARKMVKPASEFTPRAKPEEPQDAAKTEPVPLSRRNGKAVV
jgi:hypothetical protein